MNDLSAKRFVRSLRYTMEILANDAKCYRYEHTPEYLEVKEDLKFAIRMLEQGEEFAGRLLYKNARKIAPKTAHALAENARSNEERRFYEFIGELHATKDTKKEKE